MIECEGGGGFVYVVFLIGNGLDMYVVYFFIVGGVVVLMWLLVGIGGNCIGVMGEMVEWEGVVVVVGVVCLVLVVSCGLIGFMFWEVLVRMIIIIW